MPFESSFERTVTTSRKSAYFADTGMTAEIGKGIECSYEEFTRLARD